MGRDRPGKLPHIVHSEAGKFSWVCPRDTQFMLYYEGRLGMRYGVPCVRVSESGKSAQEPA